MNTIPIFERNGDHAITIRFGNTINDQMADQVFSLFQLLKKNHISGVIDLIPAYSTLTVVYDIIEVRKHSDSNTASQYIQDRLQHFLNTLSNTIVSTCREIEIPVCYHSSLGIDMEEIADQKNISTEEIIRLHSNNTYRVYLIGFLPGFPYMGSLDEKLLMPRKKTPKIKVLSGSIGIAGLQTGIYPFDSPGGWNIIGQTPLKLFDPSNSNPCLLQPGDHVRFIQISLEEFNQLKSL
jgi:inhibitor of KinA